jgi:hypothetical protein
MTTYYYKDGNGREYDLCMLSDKAREYLNIFLQKYQTATAWHVFHYATEHMAISLAKEEQGEKWKEHTILKIQRDLTCNAGIRNKELQGIISDMIIQYS